jgi:uncharacterized membrane protein SpoIIM required for sporulation
MKLDFSFWINASTRRKRIYSIIAIFGIALIVTVIGSYVPLSASDAQTISKNLNETINQTRTSNTITQYIDVNNFQICLLMFVPVVGALSGLAVLFSTGVALGAIATTSHYPVWVGLVSLVITPVFWLEFAAYSIAMAESIWLFRRLTQKRWGQIRNTLMYIGICSLILLLSAYVEVWLITLA